MRELIIPRRSVRFEQTDGILLPYSLNEVPPAPLSYPLAKSQTGDVSGFQSGYRSGLVEVNGRVYKVKGCRPSTEAYGCEPKGSQLWHDASNEAEMSERFGELFGREGINYPIKPVGFWIYDTQFQGSPNVATIYETQGDTRFDELLLWLERNMIFDIREWDEKLEERKLRGQSLVYRSLGLKIGRLLRILHDNGYAWDKCARQVSNAHSGNVAVFINDCARLDVGLIDLDDAIRYSPSEKNAMRAAQKWDLQHLLTYIKRPLKFSSKRPSKTLIDRFKGSRQALTDVLFQDSYDDGYLIDLNTKFSDLLGYCLNLKFRKSVRTLVIDAIMSGYEHPDQTIPEATLTDLMVLKAQTSFLSRASVRTTKRNAADSLEAKLNNPNRKRVVRNVTESSVMLLDWSSSFLDYFLEK